MQAEANKPEITGMGCWCAAWTHVLRQESRSCMALASVAFIHLGLALQGVHGTQPAHLRSALD